MRYAPELERDHTKTYVVEISPLGLVEMTRQNVTDGHREILTRQSFFPSPSTSLRIRILLGGAERSGA